MNKAIKTTKETVRKFKKVFSARSVDRVTDESKPLH